MGEVEQLVRRSKKRNPDAFTELMQLHERDMYRTASAILSQDADIADAMQETILTCWEKIDTLQKNHEETIGAAFPQYRIYRAWTSKMILAKIEKRDHIHYDNVKEAMERMAQDGIEEVIVQPTHVMNGVENDLMKADVLAAANHFQSVKFGNPLLTTEEDNAYVVKTITDVFPVIQDKKTALVLMGHGTEHYANTVYAALDYRFKDMGYENVIVATVEGYPEIDQALNQLEKSDAKKVVIAPFMIVAGDHAKNDMAGEEADSWKNVIGAKGYKVETVLKGLGEYESIRRLFVEHIKTAR